MCGEINFPFLKYQRFAHKPLCLSLLWNSSNSDMLQWNCAYLVLSKAEERKRCTSFQQNHDMVNSSPHCFVLTISKYANVVGIHSKNMQLCLPCLNFLPSNFHFVVLFSSLNVIYFSWNISNCLMSIVKCWPRDVSIPWGIRPPI